MTWRRGPTIALSVAMLLLVAGTPGWSFAAEPSAPRDMTERLLNAPLPGRDPFDLAVRLRGLPAATPRLAPTPTTSLVPGFQDSFWILDQRSAQLFQAEATLRLVTDHAYWFVESALADRVAQSDLERSATVFETSTVPLITRYFGALPALGADGHSNIVFLLGNIPSVAAYFSSADAYPRAINPRSNEHDMIYVNLNTLRPGQIGFDSTITHELQHMAQFNHCPNQESWVDEGASELAMRVGGYEGAPPLAFAAHPDTQLTAWTTQPAEVSRHYQASYLFLRYVVERAGGWAALPELLSTCERGEGLFSSFLSRQPIAPDLEHLFADWTVANLLQDSSVAEGRYAYAGGDFRAAVTGAVSRQSPFLGSVPQYAANYVDLPPGPGSATFSGQPLVPLLGADLDAAGVWWSNRGDSLDSQLSRQLDLRGLTGAATLRFKAWFDLEDQFDFVYLSASADGGRTWQVLHGQHAQPDHGTGNNYGAGWTGSSGSAWLDETVDLSPFTGSEVLLRFEYVTDQSYNGQGFALRDLQVPELGLDEPGADEGSWRAEGWVRVDGPIPENWNLRLVRWRSDGIQVEPIGVGSNGTASFALDEAAVRQTLVIAPTAPRTLLPANYAVTLGE